MAYIFLLICLAGIIFLTPALKELLSDRSKDWMAIFMVAGTLVVCLGFEGLTIWGLL